MGKTIRDIVTMCRSWLVGSGRLLKLRVGLQRLLGVLRWSLVVHEVVWSRVVSALVAVVLLLLLEVLHLRIRLLALTLREDRLWEGRGGCRIGLIIDTKAFIIPVTKVQVQAVIVVIHDGLCAVERGRIF